MLTRRFNISIALLVMHALENRLSLSLSPLSKLHNIQYLLNYRISFIFMYDIFVT